MNTTQAMIMRVIAMTPEQINMLPPPERAGIIQLVSSCSRSFQIPYSVRLFYFHGPFVVISARR